MKLLLTIGLIFWFVCGFAGAWRLDDLHWKPILRGPLTIKHPYLPENVKLVTYNLVGEDVTKRLHEAWNQSIGRMK